MSLNYTLCVYVCIKLQPVAKTETLKLFFIIMRMITEQLVSQDTIVFDFFINLPCYSPKKKTQLFAYFCVLSFDPKCRQSPGS